MPYDKRMCPGRCNQPYRDAVDFYDQAVIAYEEARAAWRFPLRYPAKPVPPAPPDVRLYLGDPVWHPGCAQRIHAALRELDDLASQAQAEVDGHRDAGARYGRTGVTAKTHAGSPSPVTDLLDQLYGDLIAVEDPWRRARGYQARPQRTRGGSARRASIAFLLDELDLILEDPWSVDFGRSVLAWQHRLRALTKSDPAARRSPIRCPRCKEVARLWLQDDGYYKCGTCEKLMSQSEHDRELFEQSEQEAHTS
ncbi:hypothetical protein [Streptosporangium longisporum]|uniref:GATA-type domain-containing protein n=1 Tax=Streptosporangium longisporum TaxID=46187 RepID=A0ABP6L388_9ACTN